MLIFSGASGLTERATKRFSYIISNKVDFAWLMRKVILLELTMSILATFTKRKWLCSGVFQMRKEQTKYWNFNLNKAFGLKRTLMAKNPAHEPVTLQ